ncbi:MAG: hypothetical protein ABIH92_05715 [Nanoarchaeota archaeon]
MSENLYVLLSKDPLAYEENDIQVLNVRDVAEVLRGTGISFQVADDSSWTLKTDRNLIGFPYRRNVGQNVDFRLDGINYDMGVYDMRKIEHVRQTVALVTSFERAHCRKMLGPAPE